LTAASLRNRELGLIHAAKKALGMEDWLYREMLSNLTGKNSAAKLDQAERRRVIEHLRKSGFATRADAKQSPPPKGRGSRGGRLKLTLSEEAWAEYKKCHNAGQKPQSAYICALWVELRVIGALRHKTASVERYMERNTNVSRPQWLTPSEANNVIEGLIAWIQRHRVKVAL